MPANDLVCSKPEPDAAAQRLAPFGTFKIRCMVLPGAPEDNVQRLGLFSNWLNVPSLPHTLSKPCHSQKHFIPSLYKQECKQGANKGALLKLLAPAEAGLGSYRVDIECDATPPPPPLAFSKGKRLCKLSDSL